MYLLWNIVIVLGGHYLQIITSTKSILAVFAELNFKLSTIFFLFQDPDLPRHVKLSHLDLLLNYEKFRGIKSSHKLSHKVLHPSKIERQNVSLAVAATHESTVAALRLLAMEKGKPELTDTADFLELLQRWFKICNVRGKGQEKRWNDPLKAVIELGSGQAERNLNFLMEVGEFMQEWYASDRNINKKFSKDTALGMFYTSRGLAASSRYILEKHNDKAITYICLGKMSSDAEENAFGHRRRMCGSNYWTHVRQFFESEGIVRRINLLQFSRYSLQEVKREMEDARKKQQLQDDQVAQFLIQDLQNLEEDSAPKDLLACGSAGYFSGYLGRMTMKNLESCCSDELFSDSNHSYEPDSPGYYAKEEFEALTRMLDRGLIHDSQQPGLKYPSKTLCHVTCIALNVWDNIINNKERKQK